MSSSESSKGANPFPQAIPPTAGQVVDAPHYYFNGFSMGLSNADIQILLLTNNLPTAALNLSYTTAKTLHMKLEELITQLEKATGRTIMTTEDVGAGLDEAFKK